MAPPVRITVCPVVDLSTLPPGEIDVLRRVFGQHIQGLDRRNKRRMNWLLRKVCEAVPGEAFEFEVFMEREPGYHRMHRAVLTRLFQVQQRYYNEKALHDWLKMRCVFVTWENGKPKPRSTSFRHCPEADLREFHNNMVDLLYEPAVQFHLFEHLADDRERHDMVESVLNPPKDAPE
jgi:hypothetical protein